MRVFWLATYTLWQRECVRFLRQRSRVIGAVVPPVLFWYLIGSGLGHSFRVAPSPFGGAPGAGELSYLQYFFPGTIVLITLFTAIFSTISVIDDRHAGFLQSVLVAPLSRVTLVLGKILGGATLAFGQAGLFLLLAPAAHIVIPWHALPILLLSLGLLSVGLTGLGFLLAWLLDSTQGFHAIMNLLLIPMWLLSGALFPASGAAGWMRWVMKINPLSYGLSTLQSHFLVNGQPLLVGSATDAQALVVSGGFALLMFGLSVWAVKRRSW